MTTQREVAEALARSEPLTAAECSALMQKVALAITEIQPDWARVHPGAGSVSVGTDRKAALLSGDEAEVRRAKEEFEKLDASRSSLQAQSQRLRELREQAISREAFEGLPGLHAALVDRIAEAEEARRAMNAALDLMEAAYQEISQARRHCSMGGFVGADAEGETIERLVALAPVSSRSRVSGVADPALHRSNLGPVFDHLGNRLN